MIIDLSFLLEKSMESILFVCLGNICRSPAAEGIFAKEFAKYVKKNKMNCSSFMIDSAGTSKYHLGNAPDSRMIQACKKVGYSIGELKARQVILTDFYMFDLILAMDSQVLEDLKLKAPADASATIKLFMDYHPDENLSEVPDPYFGKEKHFVRVINLIKEAMPNLLTEFKDCKNRASADLDSFEI